METFTQQGHHWSYGDSILLKILAAEVEREACAQTDGLGGKKKRKRGTRKRRMRKKQIGYQQNLSRSLIETALVFISGQ